MRRYILLQSDTMENQLRALLPGINIRFDGKHNVLWCSACMYSVPVLMHTTTIGSVPGIGIVISVNVTVH